MTSHTRVLVVDADGARATTLLDLLAPAGYETSHLACVEQATSAYTGADVALLALDANGAGAVTRLAALVPDASIVLLVDARGRQHARDALRLGAWDAVECDQDAEALLFAVERAARDARQRRELATLRARMGDDARHALAGRSPAIGAVRELIGRAAASRMTVLVTGEQGTGKSIVARLVHELSDRAARPFIVVRCEGSDPRVLEDELFGTSREGLLESARGGTLVLDEAGAMTRPVRSRLAAMLAARAVTRAGAAMPVDVRLILTVRTADEAPAPDAGALLGERNALSIALPPLRERRSDIPLLVQHFRECLARDRGIEIAPVGSETMTPLLGHEWPGNVRELEHWMERLAHATAGDRGAAPRAPLAPGSDFAQLDAARLSLDALERKYILHVLAQESGHQSRAAERLGIDRRTLYRKLKEYREAGVTVRVASL